MAIYFIYRLSTIFTKHLRVVLQDILWVIFNSLFKMMITIDLTSFYKA
jgi:hypothetical protein